MLSKTYRLSGARVFKKIYLRGQASNFGLLRVRSLPGQNWKFAIVVSKKVEPSSVKRHLFARQVRAVLRDVIKMGLPQDKYQVIFTLRSKPSSFKEIESAVNLWHQSL